MRPIRHILNTHTHIHIHNHNNNNPMARSPIQITSTTILYFYAFCRAASLKMKACRCLPYISTLLIFMWQHSQWIVTEFCRLCVLDLFMSILICCCINLLLLLLLLAALLFAARILLRADAFSRLPWKWYIDQNLISNVRMHSVISRINIDMKKRRNEQNVCGCSSAVLSLYVTWKCKKH